MAKKFRIKDGVGIQQITALPLQGANLDVPEHKLNLLLQQNQPQRQLQIPRMAGADMSLRELLAKAGKGKYPMIIRRFFFDYNTNYNCCV